MNKPSDGLFPLQGKAQGISGGISSVFDAAGLKICALTHLFHGISVWKEANLSRRRRCLQEKGRIFAGAYNNH
jgi:hypothetical protein